MPNPILPIDNGNKMLDVRQAKLNPVIDKINNLVPTVEGLQVVTALAMTNPTVDSVNNKIVYKVGNTVTRELDLSDMLNKFPHGVDITDDKGHFYPQESRINFNGGATVRKTGVEVYVDVQDVKGTIGGTTESLTEIRLSGGTGSSDIQNGVMTIDLAGGGGAGGQIQGQIESGAPVNISKVVITGNVKNSELGSDTLKIDIPDTATIQGKLAPLDPPTPVNTIAIIGNRGHSTISKGEMQIELPFNSAQIGGAAPVDFHKTHVIGNLDGTKVENDVLTLKMPQSISVQELGSGKPVIGEVSGFVFANSTVAVDTSNMSNPRVLVTPNGMMGQITSAGDAKPVTSIQVEGDLGGSTITSQGKLVLDLPYLKGNVDGTGTYKDVSKIKITGNKAGTEINNGELTINIPTGGGGGPGGTLSGVVKKPTGDVTGDISTIEISGDVDNTNIDGNTLKIELPHASGLNVTDLDKGGATYTAVTALAFENSTIGFDSSKHTAQIMAKPLGTSWNKDADPAPTKTLNIRGYTEGNEVKGGIATINIPDIQAKVLTDEGSLKQVEVTGNVGNTTYHDGKLTIDLPTGGGGGGTTSGVKGQVGTTKGDVDLIKIIGNIVESDMDTTNKTLNISIPEKPSFTDSAGGDEKNIDIVEVAQSTIKVSDVGGKRKVLITPHVTMFFQGWFPSMDALEAAVPDTPGNRIPTRTSAYVMNGKLNKEELVMWMPDMSGTTPPAAPSWKVIKNIGSIAMWDNGVEEAPILSVEKNPMAQVDPQGKLVITDCTVPNVLVDICNEDGTAQIKKGHFTKMEFIDGSGEMDLNTVNKTLTMYRAQRRLAMGTDPDAMTAPVLTTSDHEGSIFLNKSDHSWWGFANNDVVAPAKKWSKVLHAGMSDEVTDLSTRVPFEMQPVTVSTMDEDNVAWQKSGWTYIDKSSRAMPIKHVGVCGGHIQTFVSYNEHSVGQPDRTQILHLTEDATCYKRYWKYDATQKWSEWKKFSFNDGDLTAHNRDEMAHRDTHPYYKAFSFGCNYNKIADNKLGSFKYIIENDKVGLIATDGRKHTKDSEYIDIPYGGTFSLRGLMYLGGRSDIRNTSYPGRWVITLQKCPGNSATYEDIGTETYIHATTTLKYPPVSFAFEHLKLDQDDRLRLKIQYILDAGKTEDQFLAAFPELWIMPGRSYFSIDEDGNDTGYCMAKAMSEMYGGFVSMGAGAFAYPQGTWPDEKGIIVGDGIDDAVEAL